MMEILLVFSKFSLKQIDFKLSISLSSGKLPLSEMINFELICNAKYSVNENGFKKDKFF